MDIGKLIDDFGDDVFAIALIVTKDFTQAKRVFVETVGEEFPENAGLFEIAKTAYRLCGDADVNDAAVTFTDLELNASREEILKQVLQKPQIIRTIIHMYYENDFTSAQISEILGESEKYVKGVLLEIPEDLGHDLEEEYKTICTKIRAGDELKAYAVRCAESGKSDFKTDSDAVPRHIWKRWHKVVVVIIAAIVSIVVLVVIPILQAYRRMREEEGQTSWDEVSSDEIFSYSYETSENESGAD